MLKDVGEADMVKLGTTPTGVRKATICMIQAPELIDAVAL